MSYVTTTGAQGLQIKNGSTINASISQASALACSSCTIGGNTALTSTYNPLFCAGRINTDGTKALDVGRVSFTSARTATGVYVITYSTQYPNTNYIASATGLGFGGLAGIGTNNTSQLKLEVNMFINGTLSNNPFYFMVF